MGAHIEWLHDYDKLAIVRAGASFNEYGDPYDFAFILFVNGDAAHLAAGTGELNSTMSKEILRMLADTTDLKTISWERKRVEGGKSHIAGPFNLSRWKSK